MKYISIIFCALLVSCNSDNQVVAGPETLAVGTIHSVIGNGVIYVPGDSIGRVNIVYQDGVTTMNVSISNLDPNTSHAMHLHMGTLEEPSHHWNQNVLTAFCNATSLGEVWAKPFAGDVGNIDVGADGTGSFTIQTDLWSLGTDEDSDIVGTVLYIHENEEDFLNECDPNHSHNHGHVNAKIAGGTILLDNSSTVQ